MRIAFVNQPRDGSLPPGQTSLAIWFHQVARRLARSCDVTVYGRRMGSQNRVEHLDGVRYCHISVRFDRRLHRFLERLPIARSAQRPLVTSRLYGLEYILNVAKDLRASRQGLVLLSNYAQFAPVVRMLNRRARIALHMHCEWLTQFDPAMIERRLRSTDLIVGCSTYITDKVRHGFPQYAARCRTLLNGVDVDHFVEERPVRVRKPESSKRLLFVGRVSPEKGVHVLLDAFGEVLERYPKAELKIVGALGECPREFIVDLAEEKMISDLARFYDGRGYSAHLQERLASTNLADRVTFAGFVPHAQAVDHYRDADVLINPSLSEAFGMSLVEAMACGVPAVATRVGGMPEIVQDGKTGLLVKPNDARALAGAVLRLLDDENQRRSMGQAGRARAVELFSWDRIAEDVRRLCAEDREVSDAADVLSKPCSSVR